MEKRNKLGLNNKFTNGAPGASAVSDGVRSTVLMVTSTVY